MYCQRNVNQLSNLIVIRVKWLLFFRPSWQHPSRPSLHHFMLEFPSLVLNISKIIFLYLVFKTWIILIDWRTHHYVIWRGREVHTCHSLPWTWIGFTLTGWRLTSVCATMNSPLVNWNWIFLDELRFNRPNRAWLNLCLLLILFSNIYKTHNISIWLLQSHHPCIWFICRIPENVIVNIFSEQSIVEM